MALAGSNRAGRRSWRGPIYQATCRLERVKAGARRVDCNQTVQGSAFRTLHLEVGADCVLTKVAQWAVLRTDLDALHDHALHDDSDQRVRLCLAAAALFGQAARAPRPVVPLLRPFTPV